MNKHIIKPWTIIIITCLLTELLLTLNEIFASGSENAIAVINVLFLTLIATAVIMSFGSNFSQFYKISVWLSRLWINYKSIKRTLISRFV